MRMHFQESTFYSCQEIELSMNMLNHPGSWNNTNIRLNQVHVLDFVFTSGDVSQNIWATSWGRMMSWCAIDRWPWPSTIDVTGKMYSFRQGSKMVSKRLCICLPGGIHSELRRGTTLQSIQGWWWIEPSNPSKQVIVQQHRDKSLGLMKYDLWSTGKIQVKLTWFNLIILCYDCIINTYLAFMHTEVCTLAKKM